MHGLEYQKNQQTPPGAYYNLNRIQGAPCVLTTSGSCIMRIHLQGETA